MKRYAYADPPYFGWARYYAKHHPEYAVWDDIATHAALIDWLSDEFDGWAMSLHSPSLRTLLPLCPPDVRVVAWCKSFASWKPSQRVAYCWEPVIVRGARARTDRSDYYVRDYCVTPIALRRGLRGAKPEPFVRWIVDVLGVRFDEGDELVDVFPGTGAVSRAVERIAAEPQLRFYEPVQPALELGDVP